MVLKRIGLTGATGMLGRHIHAALNAAGAEVVAVSRSGGSGSTRWNLADWLEPDALDVLFPKVDAIVHAGALVYPPADASQADLFDVNVRACANLAEWASARSIPVVFISSSSVYANPDAGHLREDAPLGRNDLGGFYGMTKLLAEDMLARFRTHGLQLAVVRPSALYGSGGPVAKIPYKFLNAAARGETITLTPPLDDRIDFVHAADLSDAVVRIIERSCWATFNIASGAPVSIRELAAACGDVAGQPDIALLVEADARPPVHRFFLDTGLAQQRLDWHPRIGIRQGLSMVLAGRLTDTQLSQQNQTE